MMTYFLRAHPFHSAFYTFVMSYSNTNQDDDALRRQAVGGRGRG